MEIIERQPGEWQHAKGFYRSFKPCCICGTKFQTGLEPRFGYVVCEHHSDLSPVQVGERRVDI